MTQINQNIFEINPKELKRCIYSDIIFYARVYKIYDGDTISIIFNYKDDYIKYSCRVNRIDTPEIRSNDELEKKYAYIAKNYLSNMILDKIIKVKVLKFDKYGRLLVELYNPDTNENINDMMVSSGYANEYNGGTKKPFNFE